MRFTLAMGAAALALSAALPALAQSAEPAGAATGSSTATSASAPAATSLSVGQPVKDKTGAVIGSIAELKPGAGGSQTATVKMGEQSFAIGSESFVVQNGAAVINATQAELKQMIANAAKPG